MSVKIPVGLEFFERMREENFYYVDKTEFINELVQERSSGVTLFTRPRRFGKTLTMNMLYSFFDNRRDSSNAFADLAIMQHKEFCEKWMNQYPVVFLTLKGIEGVDFASAYKRLSNTVAKLYQEFSLLEESTRASSEEKAKFRRLSSGLADVADIKDSLELLTKMLHDYYGKPAILIVDEYDVPLAKANESDTERNDFYPRMLDVIRGMFDAAMKTNEHLQFAVLTGCLRISKESIFTGMNNFACYSVLDDKFGESFGFSEKEVRDMLSAIEVPDKFSTVKKWYDGYVFGRSRVFCPWDVVCYVADLKDDREARPKNYWRNTSGNGVLLTFVGRTDFDVSDKFEELLNGGTIRQEVYDELTYDSLHDSEENLWSVLLMTGYVTKARPGYDGELVELRLPNAEVASIFEDAVVKHFRQSLDTSRQRELLEALWQGDEAKASELMTDILFTTISYHDYHENYYHAFLTGLLTGMGYAVKSNQENGLGRTDIDIREKKLRRAMIIEAKKSASRDDMENDALAGGRQIVDKEYLKGFEGYKSVLCYGVAFFRKQALVKRLEV